jgi:hypothetical protein
MNELNLPPLPRPAHCDVEVVNVVGDYLFFTAEQMREYARAAVATEREACARECWEFFSIEGIAQKCNAAIRARGAA